MIRTIICNQYGQVIESILNKESFIKSRKIYPGFGDWFRNWFMPKYRNGVQ